MSGHPRYTKFLEEINNICEEFSEIDEGELSESEDILFENDNDQLDTECEPTDTEDEEGNIVNICRGRKRMKLQSSAEDENEKNDQCISIDGNVWEEMQIGATPGSAPLYNIFTEEPGPTEYVKRRIMKSKLRTSFSLLIDHRIMKHIRTCTIEEANRVLRTEWSLSQAKLDAFIAILYARGAYEAKNLKISYLWNKKWGPKFFSETMSRNCFTELLRFIRFDKKSERNQRLKTDKFVMISEVWNTFIENSQKCYKLGANVTVGEQLFPTKVRCRFTQYVPNKPDKFGIKFWLASDLDSKYIINGLPYLGKDEARDPSVPLAEYAVLKLIEPFTGYGRTVTIDSFFISESLATELLAKRTMLVGTLRSNKRKCIPETVSFHNKTKFGVDTIDQMARKYSVKSKSRRWPVQVFFNILDLAAINAWVLYKETTGENISRQDFLFQLAEELAAEYQEHREEQKGRTNMEGTSTNSTTISYKRKVCQVRYCKDNKTTKVCCKCQKYVCGKCIVERSCICKKCGEQ